MTIFKWDIAEDWQLGFQDSASPVMEEIVNFHNYVMIYLTFILIATSWIMAETMRSYGKSKKIIAHKYLIHGTTIEIIWTVTPAIVLILIAFPHNCEIITITINLVKPKITVVWVQYLEKQHCCFFVFLFFEFMFISIIIPLGW